MTDQNQGQDVELHDESEIMEMQGHDPANAEAQSVASLDAADEVTASKRNNLHRVLLSVTLCKIQWACKLKPKQL